MYVTPFGKYERHLFTLDFGLRDAENTRALECFDRNSVSTAPQAFQGT
jgi:hypothetical protein